MGQFFSVIYEKGWLCLLRFQLWAYGIDKFSLYFVIDNFLYLGSQQAVKKTISCSLKCKMNGDVSNNFIYRTFYFNDISKAQICDNMVALL